MSAIAPATLVPRAGLLATVRNRRGVIPAVRPFDGETGRLHRRRAGTFAVEILGKRLLSCPTAFAES